MVSSKRRAGKGPLNEIKKYLREEGIERLTYEETLKKFISEGNGRIDKLFRRGLILLESLNLKPGGYCFPYDVLQSFCGHYDYRVSFLSLLVKQIDFRRSRVIVDGGCATGLDICCLATHYPGLAFFGYDKSKRLIDLANERKQRLGLDNVTFYVSDHRKPHEGELRQADLLYASSSGLEKREDSKSYIPNLEGMCERIKKGGFHIAAGRPKPASDTLNRFFADGGLIHKNTQFISSFKRDLPNIFRSIDLKPAKKTFLARFIPEEIRLYMDIYEVAK